MRLRSLIGLALILLLGGYTLAGFVVLPLVMESLAPEKLSGYLKRPVSLKDLSFNPFSMTLVVEDLRVMEPHRQERFVACEKLRVDMQLTSGLKLKPKVERLCLTRPCLRIVRKADNRFNFSDLMAGEAEADKTAMLPAVAPERASAPKQGKGAAKTEVEPFVFAVDHLRVVNGEVEWIDHAVSAGTVPAVLKLKDIRLTLENFSTAPEKIAQVALNTRINDTAGLALAGSFGYSPLTADAHLNLSSFEAGWAQPYLPESAKLLITGGDIDLTAEIDVDTKPDKALTGSVTGRAGCQDLGVVQEETGGPLFSLVDLSMEGIHVRYNPLDIRLDQIVIAGLKQQVTINEDGDLNLAGVFGSRPAETDAKSKTAVSKETSAAKQEAGGLLPFPVEIGEITINDMVVAFSDKHLKPPFASRLILSEGHIKGLTSRDFEGADLMVTGNIDRHASLDIKGSINPFLKDLLVDAAVELENLELSPFSVYSGKYIGRGIKKGKLNLDLDYEIKEKKLAAENRILIDQFTLGEKVDSPEALQVPVGLAVAMLKDRHGEINLDIPVTGRLDDPGFSVAAVIWQSIKNIMVKAAASPFALAGNLVGGGEELRYIVFDHGVAVLDEKAIKKLDNVDELLFKRPALRLDITGYVDREKDRAALARKTLEQKLKSLKGSETGQKKGKSGLSAADMTLSEDEYSRYLRRFYKQAVLSDPEIAPAAKPIKDPALTQEEMRSVICRQLIAVPDAELSLLAKKRAEAVKNYLIDKGRVKPARLFVLKEDSLMPPDTDRLPEARVVLGLQK